MSLIAPEWACAMALTAVAVFAGTQTYRLAQEQARHAETQYQFAGYREEQERQRAVASEQARKKEQELRHVAVQAQAQADAFRQQLDRQVVTGRVASQRLRDTAARLAANPACAASPAAVDGEARPFPSRVLADVLGEIEQHAGSLAAETQRSRTAGLHCEALYDAAVGVSQ